MVVEERPRDVTNVLEPEVQRELREHPGKWAALTPSRVIAIRDTSLAAYEAAQAAGVDAPILYHIPDNRTGYSYF